jgi:NAD-dependent dihydropyrimidine dehydrogenase PreA subunit
MNRSRRHPSADTTAASTEGKMSAISRRGTQQVCAPDRIRTCDPRIRRPLLYPAELRGRGIGITVGRTLGITPCGSPGVKPGPGRDSRGICAGDGLHAFLITQCGVRWKTTSSLARPARSLTIWAPVDPVPITATRRPSSWTEWSHCAEWNAAPAKMSSPSIPQKCRQLINRCPGIGANGACAGSSVREVRHDLRDGSELLQRGLLRRGMPRRLHPHPTSDEPDYLTAEVLYVNPDDCIDCGACVDVCPVECDPRGLRTAGRAAFLPGAERRLLPPGWDRLVLRSRHLQAASRSAARF